MSTDRPKKSFIGSLSYNGKPVCIEWVFKEGRGGYKRLVVNANKSPTTFDFRWENDSYSMHVRDTTHEGQLVHLNSHGEIAVSPANEATNTEFDFSGFSPELLQGDSIKLPILVKPGQPITLDIKTGAGVIVSSGEREKKIYFKTERTKPVAVFTLNVIERH
ncbi:hypothetical protein ACIP66_09110 [Pseudomonas sp. NPDC088429]|uniref:hypothetical protein n=1 Tax=Pseudomonas sp. NPDC088429 TaxID=3364455 RepID=UPI00380A78BC